MCGLYGFSSYNDQPISDIARLTNALAVQSAVRGTDATGIAFCDGGNLNVQKHPKAAYALDFKPPVGVRVLIGHTRHSTHGVPQNNANNHPFTGRVGSARFALAHNGVLTNDDILQKKFNFKSKIETDSYVAVQLIEQQKRFDINAIRHVLYNCTVARPTIESSTKEASIEPGTETLSITADPREDGLVKSRTGDETTTATYNNWYKNVYVPSTTTGGSGSSTSGT
jgi:glutamine phosphoribosylpyrophosphate amidotransferase